MYLNVLGSLFFSSWLIERLYYYKYKHNQGFEKSGLLKLNQPLNNDISVSGYKPIDLSCRINNNNTDISDYESNSSARQVVDNKTETKKTSIL